ncbi:MAG: hypothetical protein U0168_17435 [Nannocystaceae bacterium]
MLDASEIDRPKGEPRIRGAILLNNLVGFEDVVGADVVRRALAGLPPELVHEASTVVPVAWVRADLVDSLFAASAHAAKREPEELFPEAIERGVYRTLHTVWRALMHLSSDAAIVMRTPALFARTYSCGRLKRASSATAPRRPSCSSGRGSRASACSRSRRACARCCGSRAATRSWSAANAPPTAPASAPAGSAEPRTWAAHGRARARCSGTIAAAGESTSLAKR